jgi:hypothetical protein
MGISNGVKGLWVEGIKVVGAQVALTADPAALTDTPASADALRDDIEAKYRPVLLAITACLKAHGLMASS